MKTTELNPWSRSEPRFDVIVIGASAGGLQALGVLLPQLPPTFGPAIVVVLHQPADHSSQLAKVFSARCRLPVCMAQDKQPIRSGSILFAPPGYHTLIEADASIALSLEAPEHFSRPSIDALFESAAWALHERVLGILLTGASSDGAAGLAAIQRAGGGAWVQDPKSALSETMPRSAIGQGIPLEILTLEQISNRLTNMATAAARDAGSDNKEHS